MLTDEVTYPASCLLGPVLGPHEISDNPALHRKNARISNRQSTYTVKKFGSTFSRTGPFYHNDPICKYVKLSVCEQNCKWIVTTTIDISAIQEEE